jgi:hypothetical protein
LYKVFVTAINTKAYMWFHIFATCLKNYLGINCCNNAKAAATHMFMIPGKRFILLLFIICSLRSAAQTFELPIAVPANLKSFVSNGYSVLGLTKGDLNRDNYGDAIMVLYKKSEKQTSDVIDHPEKRPLLILVGQPDRSFKLANRNDNAVFCVDCGGQMGDPFTGVTVKKGYFSVEHYGGSGWRWTRIITFKYSPADKNWFLHKDGGERFHAITHEEVKSRLKQLRTSGKYRSISLIFTKTNNS